MLQRLYVILLEKFDRLLLIQRHDCSEVQVAEDYLNVVALPAVLLHVGATLFDECCCYYLLELFASHLFKL